MPFPATMAALQTVPQLDLEGNLQGNMNMKTCQLRVKPQKFDPPLVVCIEEDIWIPFHGF